MGSSQRRKPTRQPPVLSFRGGGTEGPREETTTTTETDSLEALRVPLVRIRVEVLRQSSVGDSVTLVSTNTELLVSSVRGVVGEVPPHYEQPVRRGGFTDGVLVTADPDKPAATIVVRHGG